MTMYNPFFFSLSTFYTNSQFRDENFVLLQFASSHAIFPTSHSHRWLGRNDLPRTPRRDRDEFKLSYPLHPTYIYKNTPVTLRPYVFTVILSC